MGYLHLKKFLYQTCLKLNSPGKLGNKSEKIAAELKSHAEKLSFGYIFKNVDFYVKILLTKEKDHETLYKMASLILVLGSILMEIIAQEIC